MARGHTKVATNQTGATNGGEKAQTLDQILQSNTELSGRLDRLEKAIYGLYEAKGITLPSGNGSPQGADTGTEGQHIASFDKKLTAQEGQGFGDIESNAELAQLQLDSEAQQAQIVGEEAALEETLRLNILEEKSNLLPIKVGPDDNGRYLPLLRSNVEIYRDRNGKIVRDPRNNNEPMYKVKAEYGYRWWQSGRSRKIHRDSMFDNIYTHAKSARVPFGSYFSRGEINPSIKGEDFSFTLYGTLRWNLLKGIFTGTRAELEYVRPMSDTKVKKLILALEPESGSKRKEEENNA